MHLTLAILHLALAQEEVAQQETQRIERAVANAHFPVFKELVEFDWSCVPDVPKPGILDLVQGGYISHTEPVILIGNPGLGKHMSPRDSRWQLVDKEGACAFTMWPVWSITWSKPNKKTACPAS